MSTYAVKIRQSADHRKAVDFFIDVCMREWDDISSKPRMKERKSLVESYTVSTPGRQAVPHDFGKDFYKFPAYLRRAAIAEAIGKVSSYLSNLKNWESSDPCTRGKRPGYPSAGYVYPAMYRDGMFVCRDTYTASVKVFIRNTWDWIDVSLCKGGRRLYPAPLQKPQ